MYGALAILSFIVLAFMFIAPEAALGFITIAAIPVWGVVADKTFKELSGEEVEKLSTEDQIKYFNDHNLYRAEQLKALKDELKNESTQEIKDQIRALKDEIAEGIGEQMKVLTAHGVALTKLQKGGGKEQPETLKSRIKKEFENIGKVTSGGSYKFRVDDVARKATIGLATITDDPIGMFLPNWAEVQSQNNKIAPSLSPFTLTADDHGVIYWTDQTTRTNNAAARSDGGAAAEQVYAWTGYSETVDNISAMVPVHKEALKHISILENEIKRLLNDDVQVALDDYCYTGSGTAPQIGGIYTRSTAFDAAAYVAAGGYTPSSANMYDLIVSMAAQIMKSSKYVVDRAWINPYDAMRMKLNKDANGVYTMPPFVIPGANGAITVSGMQIIEANSVTANTCVVGDSSKARLYSTGAAEIEVGYNLTGDFSKRILTILANLECSLLIRNAEADAFLKSTNITNDINGIELQTA